MIEHDSVWRLPREDRLTSELQEKILLHVCETLDADYKTISKATDRDRITILQALQRLIKLHYVRKNKILPQYQKSKLIFRPTTKGIIYALALLGLRLKHMPESLREGSQMNSILRFIEGSFPDSYHVPFTKRYAGSILDGNIAGIGTKYVNPFDEKGELTGISKEQESRLIREFLIEYIFTSTQREEKIVIDLELFKRDYPKTEQKKMQEFLANVSGNLESFSKGFKA